MGCTSSMAAKLDAIETERRQKELVGPLTPRVAAMRQEQLVKQQQMMRDDPECKQLMDRQLELQKRALDATQNADSTEMNKVQIEILELLQQNPKYIQMMMPNMATSTKGTSRGRVIFSRAKASVNTTEFPGPVQRMDPNVFSIGGSTAMPGVNPGVSAGTTPPTSLLAPSTMDPYFAGGSGVTGNSELPSMFDALKSNL